MDMDVPNLMNGRWISVAPRRDDSITLSGPEEAAFT